VAIKKRPKAHGSQTGGIADYIKGNKWQEPRNKYGIFAVVLEKIIDTFKRFDGSEFYYCVRPRYLAI